jgi:hypothetical protein
LMRRRVVWELPKLQRNLLSPSYTVKNDVVGSSETLATLCQISQCHIREHSNFHGHRCAHLKPRIFQYVKVILATKLYG